MAGSGTDVGLLVAVQTLPVLSPVTTDATGLDLAAALDLPVLLVCGSYLGAISHGLTALAALRVRTLQVAGVVVNAGVAPAIPLQATCDAFERFAEVPVFSLVPGGDAPAALLTAPASAPRG